jgi:hypothetical protein
VAAPEDGGMDGRAVGGGAVADRVILTHSAEDAIAQDVGQVGELDASERLKGLQRVQPPAENELGDESPKEHLHRVEPLILAKYALL